MKTALKIFAQWIAVFIMLPFTLLFFLLGFAAGKDEAISTLSQLLSLLPGKVGSYLRAGFYRFALKKCDPSAVIGFGTIFSQADTEIESGVYIGPQCNIGLCSIGTDTLLGSGVHIMSGKGQHNFDNPNVAIKDQGGEFEKISIGDNCWLGNGSLIMASIEKRCVIAAGAVVTSKTVSNTIVGGNPAKKIKDI
ncbi:DapH/DapD/GlmU-related protein [Glaciecola sp. SC05]|uniref:acyltransferase n=1 Tax=Glaciecola sp. SC05 TaxID=1987355 RepID=UPI00352717DA